MTKQRRGIGRLVASACLLIAVSAGLSAQKARKGQLNITDAVLEAKAQYKAYHLEEASSLLERISSQLSRGRKEIPTEIKTLAEQVARAERLLPKTERLRVLEERHIPLSRLEEELRQLHPRISSYLRLEIGEEGLRSSSYRGLLANFTLEVENASPSDNLEEKLVRKDLASDGSEEVKSDILEGNFPFLMPDGITLILGRKADAGLGGYDLYLSRYNPVRNIYLEPTLLGMPINSPYNDYLFAYDDETGQSILISDRFSERGLLRLYLLEGLPQVLALSSETQGNTEEPSDTELIDLASLRPKAQEQATDSKTETNIQP